MQHIKRPTEQPHQAKPGAPAAPAPEDDDPVPENIDEFRNELARRVRRFIGNRKKYWRTCKERACRRHRACAVPGVRCSNAPPLRRRSPDHTARMAAQVHRKIRAMQEGQEADE